MDTFPEHIARVILLAAGSCVAAPGKSAVPTAIVRGEDAQAQRLGKIRSGELTGMEG